MPAGSTYTPIATTTTNGSTNSYTFTSIPNTYTDLVLIINAAVTSSTDNTRIRVGNGSIDSGSNYSNTRLNGNGSTASSQQFSNETRMPVDSSSAYMGSTFGQVIRVNFMNYANTTTYKTVISRADNANYGVSAQVNLWRSTNAINQIQVYSEASTNFASGSTFTLYGIASA